MESRWRDERSDLNNKLLAAENNLAQTDQQRDDALDYDAEASRRVIHSAKIYFAISKGDNFSD